MFHDIDIDNLKSVWGGEDDDVVMSDDASGAAFAEDPYKNLDVALPDYPTEAPHIDAPTHDELAAGPTAHDVFDASVDIAQNYQDLASPSELMQGERGDCFNVAALNVLNAENPDYIHSLADETNRDGVWNVATVDRHGAERDVYVNDTPIHDGATTTDPALQAVYNATSLLYHPSEPGGFADDAMARAGATAHEADTPADAVLAHQHGLGAAVIGTYDDHELESFGPDVQHDFKAMNLYSDHAYQVAAVIHNDADGKDYAVLKNPWGSGSPDEPGNVHPAPIPIDDLHRYFADGVVGTTLPRG